MLLLYFLISAVWVFVTALPMLLVNSTDASELAGTFAARGMLAKVLAIGGGALYATGMLVEAVADGQKSAFRRVPENKKKFITHGLWAWSRHPNYAGEIILWWGAFLTAASALPLPASVAASACPFFIHFLLTRVSGVPLLEASAKKRWGDDAEYKAYKKRTPCLWPTLASVLGGVRPST